MSLYFTLRKKEITGVAGLREHYPSIPIDPEYFEILLPAFEAIRGRTGKFIDLYDWIEFYQSELEIVAEEFMIRKKQIESMTNPVIVDLGIQYNSHGPETKLIYHLHPLDIQCLIQRSLDLINIAKIDSRVFVCKGD